MVIDTALLLSLPDVTPEGGPVDAPSMETSSSAADSRAVCVQGRVVRGGLRVG